MQHKGNFDQHGNLQVMGDHMAPNTFAMFGQLVELPGHHRYPAWAIEKEYRDDAFGPHQALRHIASKSTDECAREIAEEGLRGKASIILRRSINGKDIDYWKEENEKSSKNLQNSKKSSNAVVPNARRKARTNAGILKRFAALKLWK